MEEARQAILKKTRSAAVRNQGESAEEALVSAAEEFLDEKMKTAFLAKRNALINLNRRVELTAFIQNNFADDPALGLEAIMTGVNRARTGSRLSVFSEQRGLTGSYAGGFIADIKKAGLWREFVRNVHDREATRALWRMANPQDTLDDISSEAVTIARAIDKWQNIARADANAAGAFIGDLPGYITRQTHDMFRVRQASKRTTGNASNSIAENREAWIKFVAPLLDEEKTFADVDLDQTSVQGFLESVFDTLRSGVHLTNAAPGETAVIPSGFESIAKRMSQDRILHFNDGDAWFAYNEKFGMGGLNETVVRGLELSGQQTGLMRVFGPNARMNFEAVYNAALRIEAKRGGAREIVKNQAKKLNNIFAELDGSVRIPGDAIGAQIAGSVRALQSMSKLGSATLSAISDIPLAASELRFQGKGFLESYSDVFNALRKGRGSEEMQELASMLGVGLDSVRGDVVARFASEDSLPRVASSLMAKFFKYNGLSIWTDSMRVGTAAAMSHRLALNSKVRWGALDPDLVRTLDFFGIGEKQWDVIRASETKAIDDNLYATPDGVRGVDDATIDPLIEDQLADLQERHADIIERDLKANERDRGFIDKRAKGFSDDVTKAREDLEDLKSAFAGRQDDLGAEIRDRIGRLEAEFDRAEVASDVESFVVSERNRLRVRELLGRIEEGADLERRPASTDLEPGEVPLRSGGPSIAELAARESDRFSQTRGNQGERLGARRARTERRISQATQKEKKVSKQLADRLTKREADLVRRLEKKATTFDEFVARADERMAKRRERAIELDKQFGRRVRRLREEAKTKVQSQLRSYFQDRVDFAVITPDARTNATMNRGTRRGTIEGEMLRLMMQFKSFPLAVLQRSVGRELFARGFSGPRRGMATDLYTILRNGHGEWQSLAQMVAATTAMGYLAMTAKDFTKGRIPRKPNSHKTWTAAMVQGGGLGIYGDFLFGETRNRFGGNLPTTVLGPTLGGTASDIGDLYGRVLNGDDVAASAFSDVVNHTPFANLFYTRMAIDWFILHRIREGMNPGYLRRMERRIERENDQRFFIEPSRTVPRGGGIIGDVTKPVADVLNAASPFGGEE